MYQNWCNLTFLHWRYRPAEVARLLPEPLEPDLFDGDAWVGITPFELTGLRLAWMPALPWISRFPETNCRTYVRAPDGSTGVWFFSLDAARLPAVGGARVGFGLPYAWSRMQVEQQGNRMLYRSARRWPDTQAMTDIEIECCGPMKQQPLDVFLTARFRLFSFIAGRLTATDVEHERWPLERARVIRLRQTLTAAAGVPEPEGEPLVHFSPGVHTAVGWPHFVRTGTKAA